VTILYVGFVRELVVGVPMGKGVERGGGGTAATEESQHEKPKEDELEIDEPGLLHDGDGFVEERRGKALGLRVVEGRQSNLLPRPTSPRMHTVLCVAETSI
jgi:hypothetical protein